MLLLIVKGGFEGVVDFSGDVSLEASDGFAFGFAFVEAVAVCLPG